MPPQQPVLHPARVASQRPAEHPRAGVGPALAEHQVRRQVTGLPSRAQRRLAGAQLDEQIAERITLIRRVRHELIVGDQAGRASLLVMTSSISRWRRSPRQELAVAVLLGAAGAGLVFLATRQGWAQVRTTPPRPLPASLVSVTGAALVPYADALVVAGLATLAAVLASRRLLRRLTGALLAVIGAGLAVSAFTLSAATAISAATATASPGTAAAGSVMAGSDPAASAVPDVADAAPHVTFAAAGWQALVVAGAIAMICAGVLVIWRAERMAVMSGRYDAPAGRPAGPAQGAVPQGAAQPSADSASMWEALSRGDDPT